MQKFNSDQLRAVTHRDGPMLVLAGPGSGKTAVLVGRLKYLVSQGIDPRGILVLTFSKAAALEMQTRFEKTMDPGNACNISFGTFHSIFYHILKSQGLYRRARILTKARKIEYMKMTAALKGIEKRNDLSFVERLTELVSLKKMGMTGLLEKADEDEREALLLVYDDYDRLVKNEGYIDFDDMITDCLKMLRTNDKIRRKWQERYTHILVDEFQDIDKRQYEVLKLLAGDRGNIFCVGDDDQSIYSFRGADPKVMRKFLADHGAAGWVNLGINYRCPARIIEHAGSLIRHNADRLDKNQKSISEDTGSCIIHRCFRTLSEEAQYCGQVIEDIIKEAGGIRPTEVGVLYRISRSGDILEEVLKNKGIPYRRKDRHVYFYDQEWVKDILAYLKLSISDSSEDMFRILNRPYRGVTRECIGLDTDMRSRMRSYYSDDEYGKRIDKLLCDIDFIKGMTCYGAVNYILRGIGLYDYFLHSYNRHRPDERLDEMIDDLLERARGFKSIRQWLMYIDKSRETEEEGKKEEGGDKKQGDNVQDPCMVELRTIHGAKGLEYDNVIMIGLQEGVFPLKKCEDAESLEEERRLFYVGMTRSRKRLWLTGIQRDEYGKRESRFIKEAGLSDETLGREPLHVV